MSDSTTPDLERRVATDLNSLLKGVPVGAEFSLEPTADLCRSLEFFIPSLLRLRYPKWKEESLDGVRVACAHKTGPSAVRIGGTCILMTDQTVTPFLIESVVSPTGESLESFRVCLGEAGDGSLGISGPDWGSRESATLSMTVADRIDSVEWVFEAEHHRV